MIRTFLCAFLLLAFISGYGQVSPAGSSPEPIGGIQKLSLEYFRINFSPAQKKLLLDKEIEFIYTIDTTGVATLEDINGVKEKDILDSLHAVTPKLPRFQPATENGRKQSALYFVKLQFPRYSPVAGLPSLEQAYAYKAAKLEDFEYIHKSGTRLDLVFGGMANTLTGSAGKYLAPGGGFRSEVMGTGKKGISAGLVMSFYGNNLRQSYPIASRREQNEAPVTLLVGLGLNKALVQKERTAFNLQLELNYAAQNVTASQGPGDKGYTQFQGFSPGLVANYLLQVGKSKPALYYTSPVLYSHYLNLHGAIRPVFYNQKEASGLIVELGLSYRLSTHFVDEYRLKP